MFLGRHTSLSWLAAERGLDSVPLFEESGGAPPFVIAVGDRRRAARVLDQLDDAIDLAAHCRREIGSAAAGRVAIGAGRTGTVPVLAVETQMGGPSTEIILREVLDESFHPAGARAVIRVGTCGTLSDATGTTPDLVIASFATGWSNAVEQQRRGVCGAPAEFDPTRPERPPVLRGSANVLQALTTARPDAARAGVFSKDSLYSEQDERFAALMREMGCLATEMELATIGPVAESMGVAWGGIMASAGCLDGSTWYQAREIERNEAAAIQAALAAIRILHDQDPQ